MACDVDGIQKTNLNVTTDWVETELLVKNSSLFFPHIARWTYTQGTGAFEGSDGASLDWIRFTQVRVPAPRLQLNAQPVSVAEGQPFDLVPVVAGLTPQTYQWFHDSVAIPGATGPLYHAVTSAATDDGLYYLVVTEPGGVSRRQPRW